MDIFNPTACGYGVTTIWQPEKLELSGCVFENQISPFLPSYVADERKISQSLRFWLYFCRSVVLRAQNEPLLPQQPWDIPGIDDQTRVSDHISPPKPHYVLHVSRAICISVARWEDSAGQRRGTVTQKVGGWVGAWGDTRHPN